jgi:hypothetical protein
VTVWEELAALGSATVVGGCTIHQGDAVVLER